MGTGYGVSTRAKTISSMIHVASATEKGRPPYNSDIYRINEAIAEDFEDFPPRRSAINKVRYRKGSASPENSKFELATYF